jgi:DNA-binding MarR family transcriptional regulator
MALRLIPHIHRATHRIALHVARLDPPAVNQAEAHVLAHLDASGGCTVGEVHRAFGHKRSTLTSILDRLEERDWIVRESDTTDRRTFQIALTRSGRVAARRVVHHLEALERNALRTVSASELQVVLRVLERIESSED